jgi:hypothetical protein
MHISVLRKAARDAAMKNESSQTEKELLKMRATSVDIRESLIFHLRREIDQRFSGGSAGARPQCGQG